MLFIIYSPKPITVLKTTSSKGLGQWSNFPNNAQEWNVRNVVDWKVRIYVIKKGVNRKTFGAMVEIP